MHPNRLFREDICRICGASLPAYRPVNRRACSDAACIRVVSAIERMHPAAAERYVAAQARRLREARARGEIERQQREENARHREAFARGLSRETRDRYPLTVLPSGRREPASLPQRRIAAYRDHLTRLIDEAMSSDHETGAPEIPERDGATSQSSGETTDPVAEACTTRFCRLCGGGCCVRGADTAYLTVDDIRRFSLEHPELGARQILAAYLDRLSDRTLLGSCVNHTEAGCSLPREMRSRTCNTYFCPAVKNWRRYRREEDDVRGAFVLCRKLDNWTSVEPDADDRIVAKALVTAQEIRTLESGLAGSSASSPDRGS